MARRRLAVPRRPGGDSGQAFLETVMTVGFLVAIAIVMNKLMVPVVLDAFEKIAGALASVGP